MTKKELFNILNAKKAFWSYNIKNANEISDSLLIEHTLLWGDVEELKALFSLYEFKKIKDIWNVYLVPDTRYEKLNYYLATFFFDIKKIDTYLKKKSLENSRFQKLKRLSQKY
jgi:hypothetical protein